MHQLFAFSFIFFAIAHATFAQEASVQPVRVCAIVQDLATYTGKVVAVVGRFSFRHDGRILSEENCGSGGSSLTVAFDRKLAPKTPEHLEIDSTAVTKLLKAIQQTTALTKFRFGTPDYDRWAVVYGRVEAGTPPRTAGQLVCAGDSVVMFIVDRY
jgi:hypothetical protein